MIKYMFKCQTCNTIMSIETNLDKDRIHQSPPCPCGKARMINMSSYEYAYGNIQLSKKPRGWDE